LRLMDEVVEEELDGGGRGTTSRLRWRESELKRRASDPRELGSEGRRRSKALNLAFHEVEEMREREEGRGGGGGRESGGEAGSRLRRDCTVEGGARLLGRCCC